MMSCDSLASPGIPVARHTSLTVPASSPDRGPFIVQDPSIEIGGLQEQTRVVTNEAEPSGSIEDPTDGNTLLP